MADRYWVGGTGTWSTTTTNWAASSGGTAGQSAPTSADNVFFDANSNVGTGNFTVTISGAVNCASITISGLDGILTLAGTGSQSMNIYGNVSYQASNISQSGGFAVNLRGTGSHTLDFGGRTITGNVTIFDGTYTLTSAFVGGTTCVFRIDTGTFDTGNYNMTVNDFLMSGTNTKTATLGSSTITCAGASPAITINLTNTTFTPGTSTFSIPASGTNPVISANGATFYAMTIETNTNGLDIEFISDITLTNLTFTNGGTAPSRGDTIFLDSGVTITVTGTLTATTSDVRIRNLILHTTGEHGARPTIVAAAVNLSNIDFGGINCSGAAAPFTGTSIGDYARGTTGVTFTAPKTVYWRGITGTSEADDANVFGTSSGAAGANANYPLPQDTVIVDDNTLATTLEVGPTLDFVINTLDARNRTAAINFDWENTLRFGGANGGMYYSSAVTHPTSRSTTIIVQSSGVFELDTLEKRVPYNFRIAQRNDGSSPKPKVKLLSNFLTGYSTALTGVFLFSYGELDLNGYNATCSVLRLNEFAIDTTSEQSRLTFNGGRMIVAFVTATGTVVDASLAHNFFMEDGEYIELTGGTGTGTMSVDGVNSTDSYTLNGKNGMPSIKGKANIATYGVLGSYFNNFDFSENVGTGSFSPSGRFFYGDIILKAGMTVSASTSAITFLGGETSNYNTAGLTVDVPLTIAKTGSGKVVLQGNANHTAAKTLLTTSGELDLNGYTLSAGILDLDSTTDHTIRFNGGILSSGGGTVDCNPSANLFFADPENGTLRLTSAAASVSFTIGSTSSPKFPTIDIATSQTVTFSTAGNQSIVNLKNTVSPATLLFSPNVTYTLDDFELTGTAGNLVTIDSSSNSAHTFSKSSGVIDADYLSLEYSTATGGASWYAGANSTNVGNNTGWIFTAAPTILTGNNVTQNNQSTTGAIVVLGLVDLTGNNVTQTNQSTTGAITQVQTLTGNNVTQNNTSTTGAISQAHVLTGANVAQNNLSNTGAISQIHILTGANVSQNNTSGTGAITIGPILVGNNVTQTNLSSTGAIEVIIKEDAPAGAGYSPLTLTGSQWSRPQQSAYRRPAASIRKRT